MDKFDLYSCPICNNTLSGLEWEDYSQYTNNTLSGLECPDCKQKIKEKELFRQWKEENGKEI